MSILRKRSPVEQAERDAAKAEEVWQATPAGQARQAHMRCDALFQCELVVAHQPSKGTLTDPNSELNAVCREGWELVNGSFVFVEQRQSGMDNLGTCGETVGYYLFRTL